MPEKTLSEAQLAANRANAKKSTGPRTPEGKLRSSRNSTIHGLSGRTVLLTSAQHEVYNDFIDGLLSDLHAVGPLELQIARNIADAHWRLSHIRSVEQAMFALPPEPAKPDPRSEDPNYIDPDTIAEWSEEPPSPNPVTVLLNHARLFLDNSPAFGLLSLYEQRIHRTLKNSMDELRRLQAERKKQASNEMFEALRFYRERKMHSLPFDPAADGFVCSIDEIRLELHRKFRQMEVDNAAACDYNLAKYQKLHGPKAA